MHPTIKNMVLRVSRALGYDVVPLREMKERDFALYLRGLLSQLKIDCVFDVGANAGQYHDFLRNHVGFGGTIISFEPISRHVAALKERARSDLAWHIEGYALGAGDEALPLNVMVSDQYSSFLRPDNSRVPAISRENKTVACELVPVKTLDSVLPGLRERLRFKRPYLKLDTQGFDIEVLRGGRKSVETMLGMQTEASVIGIYQGMPNYVEAIAVVEALGFELSGLYTVSRDKALRLVEFDCVFINSKVADRLLRDEELSQRQRYRPS